MLKNRTTLFRLCFSCDDNTETLNNLQVLFLIIFFIIKKYKIKNNNGKYKINIRLLSITEIICNNIANY
jgi:hypothetical protein